MTALTGGIKNSLDPAGIFHKQAGDQAKNALSNMTDPFGFFMPTPGGVQDVQSRVQAPAIIPYVAASAAPTSGTSVLTGAAASASDTTTPKKTLLGG